MVSYVALAVLAMAMQVHTTGAACYNEGSPVCSGHGSCYGSGCRCNTGYTGNRCQNKPITTTTTTTTTIAPTTPVDQCIINNPCLNNGVCVTVRGSASCACPFGVTGVRCEVISDVTTPAPTGVCINNPCLNGGACKPASDDVNLPFSCTCRPGFGGSACQAVGDFTPAPTTAAPTTAAPTAAPVDVCRNDPCLNGGLCTPAGDVITCTCVNGYTGSVCQSVSAACINNPCINGGTCRSLTATTFECVCPPGTSGILCL